MTRQYIIAAIIALIIVASLGITPAIALAVALTGVIVILMMAWEGWPWDLDAAGDLIALLAILHPFDFDDDIAGGVSLDGELGVDGTGKRGVTARPAGVDAAMLGLVEQRRLTAWGAGRAVSRNPALFAPGWPRGRHPHVRVDRYHWPLVGGTMIWIMFGVGAALGVGIGVAIGGCVAALIIGWWDRDADRTVRRVGSRWLPSSESSSPLPSALRPGVPPLRS
jgi:hypothetical protein